MTLNLFGGTMDSPIILVGDERLSLEDAYQLCGGKLMCQDSAHQAPALIDFGCDYGVIGPTLFLHRLVADARSAGARLSTLAGLHVRLHGKRVAH